MVTTQDWKPCYMQGYRAAFAKVDRAANPHIIAADASQWDCGYVRALGRMQAGWSNELDASEDAIIDRWNDAALAGCRGEPCPGQDVDSIDGHRHGLEQRKVQPVMPARHEGYYHMAPESEA